MNRVEHCTSLMLFVCMYTVGQKRTYSKTAQRIFKYSDIQYTSITLNKKLNSLIYRTLFCVNIYGSYKLRKNSLVFGSPCVGQKCVCLAGC